MDAVEGMATKGIFAPLVGPGFTGVVIRFTADHRVGIGGWVVDDVVISS